MTIREQMDEVMVRWTALVNAGKSIGNPEHDAVMAEYHALDRQRRIINVAGEVADKKVKAQAAAYRKPLTEAEVEAQRRISNTVGLFRWTKIKGRDYLQFRHRGKLVAAYPTECGRGLWKELNWLLKGTAPDLGKDAPSEIWAYSVRKNTALPKDPATKHALILQFIKALRMTARKKLTPRRLCQIADQLVRLDAVLDSFKYSWQEGQALDRSYARHYVAPARKEKEAALATSKVDRAIAAIERRESAKAEREAESIRRFGVDELFQEASLQSIREEGVLHNLQLKGLDFSEENIEVERALIMEELKLGRVSAFGSRRAKEIKAKEARLGYLNINLESAQAVLDVAFEGSTKLVDGVHKARHTYPIDPNDHGKLNNLNSQAGSEYSQLTEVAPSIKAAQQAALESLGADDLKWLTEYHADLLPTAQTEAEENRRKAKASYLKAKVLKTNETLLLP